MNLMLQPCICYCCFTCVHIKHPDYEASFIWMLASSLSLNPCQLTKADGITDCSSYLNAEFSFIFILKLLCTYVLWHWKLWYSAFIEIVVFVPDFFLFQSFYFLFLVKKYSLLSINVIKINCCSLVKLKLENGWNDLDIFRTGC